MNEYATGALHSGSSTGPVVKKHSQAVAIALSEQRQMKAAAKPKHNPIANLRHFAHPPRKRTR
jgi:hypothetical protein